MLGKGISLPVLLAAFATVPVGAVEVYRWVDANGTVHFSQWEPAAGETSVETVTVDEGSTAGIGGDVYPIAEQAEAMAALWAEIEQQRANRQKQRQEAMPAAIPYPYPEDDHAIWPVWDADRPSHPRPPFPPRPRPPENPNPPSLPYRPPGDTGGSGRGPGN